MADIFHSEEFEARCDELRDIFEPARRPHAELRARQTALNQRRAEIRASRQRFQSELAPRLAERRDLNRAAAAILEAAANAAGVSLIELWIDYFSLGGNRTLGDFRARLDGRLPMDRYDHDLVALALNERLAGEGFAQFLTYWDGSRAS